MPEIFRLEGYVFFFYANEGNEPMHVRRGGGYAKQVSEIDLLQDLHRQCQVGFRILT